MDYLRYATPRALGAIARECVQNTTWGHARCRTLEVHTDIWMLTPPHITWKYGSPVLRTLCGLYTKSHIPLCVVVCITVTNAIYAHSIDTHCTHTHMLLPFLHVLLLPLLLPSHEHMCDTCVCCGGGAGAE